MFIAIGFVFALAAIANGVPIGFGFGLVVFGFLFLASVGILFLGLAIYDRLGQILETPKGGTQTAQTISGVHQSSSDEDVQDGVDADGFETKVIGGYRVKLRPGSGGYLQMRLQDGSLRLFANEERILRFLQSGGR